MLENFRKGNFIYLFVANRVQSIRNQSDLFQFEYWHQQNQAYDLSRGVKITDFPKSNQQKIDPAILGLPEVS